MRKHALFLNGVYEDVLNDILAVHSHLPEQILFLQPYSSGRIKELAENPPSVDDPVRVLMSITTDLNRVHFIGEIVGWSDKSKLNEQELMVINRIIYMFQRTEPGVYMQVGKIKCKNLLLVRRLRRLSRPFSVEKLIKISTDEALSPERTTSGGWSYVDNPSNDWLSQFL